MPYSPTHDSTSSSFEHQLPFFFPNTTTPEQQQESLPLPQPQPLAKKSKLPPSTWVSTLCVLSGLSIIGYDIYETNKLKKKETDDAVTEPFLVLKNSSKTNKTKTVKETIDRKEKETLEAEVVTPKPVLQNSRQRPIKSVAHPTIESEQTDRFAFIKNILDRIKPHYKTGKKQSKTWFKDLKQNPRQHKNKRQLIF